MKKKAYVKNQLQIIKKTKARFLSIFCIVFLGAAFFAGLRHTSVIMEVTMDDYLKEYVFNDLNYIATLGFEETDVKNVLANEAVDQVEYGNRFDALINFADNSKGVTVYTNQDFDLSVNRLELIEGRLPQNSDECVLDYNFTVRNKVAVGDKITLTNDNGQKEFLVCGLVNDPRYFSVIERGTNTLGDGTNSAFVEILTEGNEALAFDQKLFDLRGKPVFNELRISLKNPNNYNLFSDEYLKYVKTVNHDLKKILNQDIKEVNQDIYNRANNEVNDGRLALVDGEKNYHDGMKQYDDGMKQYQDGLKQYENGIQQYQDGLKRYQDGKKEYLAGKLQYDQGMSDFLAGKQQYDQGLLKWQAGNKKCEQLKQQQKQLNALYEAKKAEYDRYIAAGTPAESLQELAQFIAKTAGELQQLQGVIAVSENQLNSAKSELDKNELVLNQSEVTLNNSKQRLEQAKSELDYSNQTLIKSKQQLDNSKKVLDETKTKLAQSKSELDKAKKEIVEAKTKLSQGEEELDNLPKSQLITLTRQENASVISYLATCDSMKALAVVFPLIFFLVAALVSLTTMTRMVEEQRVQSGTFRALGYEKIDVINQYLLYAFLATFGASILGMIAGVYFFPGIIYYLYHKMLFNVGADIHVIFKLGICIQTFVISVAITMLVTYLVVYKELNEVPASLLRPKPPKMGKRIILERISFIWQRLSFNQKVTMRNIFRYKKRFFMSVIGIAGCTALIVVGFGIKNSVSTLADKQYGNIWTYDGVSVFEQDLSSEELLEEQNKFAKQTNIKTSDSFYRRNISVLADKEHYTTLEVFDDNQEISKYMNLTDFNTGKRLTLDDQGVIISAKLSELLNVVPGDMIKIKLNDNEYQVKVKDIMLMHFQHHIYMTNAYYQELTGKEPFENYTYFKLENSQKEQSIIDFCQGNDKISSVNFIQGISQDFRDQMGSIDSVVIILITCAGALAFIVLYNLTNINIQERKSEIATIKVLGFYPREVYDYVFRENRILSIIGAIIGLGLGKIIHMFIIETVEVEVALFVRSVNLLSYIYALIITLFFTSLINLIMRKVLRKIDMVESLKSIE